MRGSRAKKEVQPFIGNLHYKYTTIDGCPDPLDLCGEEYYPKDFGVESHFKFPPPPLLSYRVLTISLLDVADSEA